jgi:hypothetical protein
MDTLTEVMLDRALLNLIDSAEAEWTDDIPELREAWPVEELSSEALDMLNW